MSKSSKPEVAKMLKGVTYTVGDTEYPITARFLPSEDKHLMVELSPERLSPNDRPKAAAIVGGVIGVEEAKSGTRRGQSKIIAVLNPKIKDQEVAAKVINQCLELLREGLKKAPARTRTTATQRHGNSQFTNNAGWRR